MSEATTEERKETVSRKRIAVFEYSGIAFFTLSLAASAVLILRPLDVLDKQRFPQETVVWLWLLFTLGFIVGLVLILFGSATEKRRDLSTGGGANYLAIGFICAVEIFLLGYYKPGVMTGLRSLWWLAVIYSVLGALGVYLPVRGKRQQLERELREEQEERRKARARKRRSQTIVVQVKRYYFIEKKLLDYKH